MGTFAETAIVDYRLSFADQGKKTSIYRFRLQQQTEVCRNRFPFASYKQKLPFLDINTSVFQIYIYAAISNAKRKPGDFP
jgi:hypothetical protein